MIKPNVLEKETLKINRLSEEDKEFVVNVFRKKGSFSYRFTGRDNICTPFIMLQMSDKEYKMEIMNKLCDLMGVRLTMVQLFKSQANKLRSRKIFFTGRKAYAWMRFIMNSLSNVGDDYERKVEIARVLRIVKNFDEEQMRFMFREREMVEDLPT